MSTATDSQETRRKRAKARAELLIGTGFPHAFTSDELADMSPSKWSGVFDQALAHQSRCRRQLIEFTERPDHEKLLALADTIEAVPIPEVSYNAADSASEVEKAIAHCVFTIRDICTDMIKSNPA